MSPPAVEYKLAKDALVASLFELSKAANEVSKNAIDFFNISQLDPSELEQDSVGMADPSHAIAAIAAEQAAAAEHAATAVAATTGGDDKGKKKKDPNAPKKPLTTYILYSNDIRAQIQSEHKEWPQTDIAREISKLWSDLDQGKKDEYKEIYEKDKARYLAEMVKYQDAKKVGVEYIPPSVLEHQEATKLKKEAAKVKAATAASEKRTRDEAGAEEEQVILVVDEPSSKKSKKKSSSSQEDGEKKKKKKSKKSSSSQTINID